MNFMKELASILMALIFSGAPALAAPTRISDPVMFVSEVLRHFVETTQSYEPPKDIYTPRLAKLIHDDEKQAKGEVGCLDFVFWVNGQDWAITKLDVKSGPASQDREIVIARFLNIGTPQEIHFDFRRIAGRWLLDDVQSVKEPRWTLSEILKCPH
jgi:hypothetical protein